MEAYILITVRNENVGVETEVVSRVKLVSKMLALQKIQYLPVKASEQDARTTEIRLYIISIILMLSVSQI